MSGRPGIVACALVLFLEVGDAAADVTCRPNVFGGQDYRLPDGGTVTSRPNVFGGRDFRGPDGRTVTCRPNIFGGEDCR